ncbi:hypothetical protein CVT26_011140 [Gymnopilus dilepis]|uniref:Uncharacterized protein n=1 Tax=Gymnopilus dilepis TaxID=231916 RepID=A0A409VYY6_9AGAR|nr:hypothetical protein CVT26_011140 [Gymnopilus dilepis]
MSLEGLRHAEEHAKGEGRGARDKESTEEKVEKDEGGVDEFGKLYKVANADKARRRPYMTGASLTTSAAAAAATAAGGGSTSNISSCTRNETLITSAFDPERLSEAAAAVISG